MSKAAQEKGLLCKHPSNENLKMLCEHCAHIVETEFPEILEEGFED